MFVLLILGFWAICLGGLWSWKKSLFTATWREPYFADTLVLIESDDWGPGGDFHAERLYALLSMFARHKDTVSRSAVLTADVVLAVPDVARMSQDLSGEYYRCMLDTHFPVIHQALLEGIQHGTLVPQLHGLEHLNGSAFATLCRHDDPRLADTYANQGWWDWENLDSPLQGHYVDGSHLPTTPITELEAEDVVQTATQNFTKLFGHPSLTTVAPCYLWNDNIENQWRTHNIIGVQTAGYRCTGRDQNGNYIQDRPLIRFGNTNQFKQIYLVRNVMYEPVDGRTTASSAYSEAQIAYRQAQPISISTHRYNFTRTEDECRNAISGLDRILTDIRSKLPNVRFLASPELVEFLHHRPDGITNHFNHQQWPTINEAGFHRKLGAFLYRLYYRHRKLGIIAYCTGLIVPAWLICRTSA